MRFGLLGRLLAGWIRWDSKRTTARGVVGFAPTFCIISAGGDELFWHWVPGTRCQNGQRTGDYSRTPMGRQAGGR